MKSYLLKYFVSIVFSIIVVPNAVASVFEYPVIGAQVFIEPGQSAESVDNWFRLLKENNMSICRIRMFENYMVTPDGEWDFSLFDRAFDAAQKYNIRVFGTLFPSTMGTDIGGFKFPESQEHCENISRYIKSVVTHYKSHPALFGWVLINEPGTGGIIPKNEFTTKMQREWRISHPQESQLENGFSNLIDFSEKNFLLDYNTWYLDWVAKEVRKWDNTIHLHVNSHSIFENIAEYDFVSWRKFLSSLGASAHPSWHFGYFDRSQYALALSINCEMVRSGAGNIPYWLTELQGGNNTYSGRLGFCPTAFETTQWLWSSIATGVDGIIFWCLNSRSVGLEAGEWALLNFQNEPSDRMQASAQVSKSIMQHRSLFASSQSFDSPISILYTKESLWSEIESNAFKIAPENYEGRLPGGVMKSAFAYYEILAENGIKANFMEMNEFDWSKDDYTYASIIIPHQIAIPKRYWQSLYRFVELGGKLIAEGLTGYFDEHMFVLPMQNNPFEKLMGGGISEIKCDPKGYTLAVEKEKLPVHLWKGYINNKTGKVVASENGNITATRHKYGKGSTFWVPSLLGLGAWKSGDRASLSKILLPELKESIKQFPIVFDKQYWGVMMQTMQSGDSYITVIINKNKLAQQLFFETNMTKAKMLFPDSKEISKTKGIKIKPEETIVLEWKK